MSLKWPAGLNRQVFVLGLVSLFADVAGEMLTPITPVFLAAVLGSSMTQIGLIEGVAEAVASLLKSSAGRWSDLLGRRRPFVVAGYLVSALAKPLIGYSYSWPQVLGARALDRFGKGIRSSPRDAILADSVSSSERARAFGWHRALDTVGAIIGPLAAVALLAWYSGDLRRVYLIAFIPGILAVALTMLVREPIDVSGAKRSRQGSGSLPKEFKKYLAVWAIFSLGNSSDAFLILRARGAGFSPTQTVLIYCLFNVVFAAASPFLGGIADRWGRKRVLAGGLVVFAVVYLGLARATRPEAIVALFTIYGLYAAATEGVGKALAIDLLPENARAFGLGLLGTVTGLAALFASFTAGVLWDRFGAPVPFYYGAVAALVAAAAIAGVRADRQGA